MTEYIIISVVFGIFLFLLIYKLFNIYVENQYWSRVVCAIILTLLFKTDWGIHFYGLEYEDAYVFNFVARQFANNIFSHSFLTDGILCGSISNPIAMGTYGGHFITYPVFLSYFFRILGFEPYYICQINTFIEFVSLCVLSVFPLKISKTNLWFLLPVIYCTAPIMNVFANTGFSETFSSCICLSFLFAILLYRNNKTWGNALFCFVSIFLSFLCKRENICLILVPFLFCLNEFYQFRKINKKMLYILAGNILLLTIYLLFIQNVFNIESTESEDIQMKTFSIHHFYKLFPVFVKSLFSFNYFLITIWLAIFSIIFAWKKLDLISVTFIILFCSYLTLYSFHYRGYFFVKHNEISTFETFRYLNNFYYLIPLISVAIINKFKTYNSWVICSPIIVIAIYSLINTFELRKGYAEMEYEDRLKIPVTVCANLEKEENFVLITEDILIYQILSINSFTICDIRDFNNCKNYLLNRNMFVLIRNNTYKYLLERYNVSFKVERSKPIFEYEDTKLYRVESFN